MVPSAVLQLVEHTSLACLASFTHSCSPQSRPLTRQARVRDCDEDPSQPECRVYDD